MEIAIILGIAVAAGGFIAFKKFKSNAAVPPEPTADPATPTS